MMFNAKVEMDFVESKEVRETYIDRVDILDKVGDLMMLPFTELATVQQVAEFYKVSVDTVKTVVKRNRDEFDLDGYKIFRPAKVIDLLQVQNEPTKKERGKITVYFNENDSLTIPNSGISLFTKRAILRVGMLLRDSDVAKEVRTQLLNVIQIVHTDSPEIIKRLVKDMWSRQDSLRSDVEDVYEYQKRLVAYIDQQFNLLNNKIDDKMQERLNAEDPVQTAFRVEAANIRSKIKDIVFGLSEDNEVVRQKWNELYKAMRDLHGVNIYNRKRIGDSYLRSFSLEELRHLLILAEDMFVDYCEPH